MKVLGLILAAAAVAGFFVVRALRPNGELRGLVESVAPVRHETLECSWGSSSFAGESKSYYGCMYLARGDLEHVGRILAARAARGGFVVSCLSSRHLIAVTATRGATTVYVDVRESGFAVFRSHHLVVPADLTDPAADLIASPDVDMPARTVLVDVSAHKDAPHGPVGGACKSV